MVGIACHVGVLRALKYEGGVDPADAELTVFTIAGSVMAADLSSGHDVEELWDLALGTHPFMEGLSTTPTQRWAKLSYRPKYPSSSELVRHLSLTGPGPPQGIDGWGGNERVSEEAGWTRPCNSGR